MNLTHDPLKEAEMVATGNTSDKHTAEANELKVSCPACMAKPGLPCASLVDSTKNLKGFHRERRRRFQYFASRDRWACQKEGCSGTRLAITAKEMLSSKEGGCPV